MFELPKNRAEAKLKDAKPLYTKGEALAEAARCLYCHDAPCITACPTGIDIPTFIKKISTDNLRGSARTILEANILGYSCARVCPVEVLCAGACVYNDWERPPIQIGKLQRYATESFLNSNSKELFKRKPPTGKKVALVGAGPASLACAAYLSLEGHETTIFEKNSLPGGLNTNGVAPYKLHSEDSLKEIEFVSSLGVKIQTNAEVGKSIKANDLMEEYDSVFLGLGLGNDKKLNIPGEEGPGVVGATHWIYKMKLDPEFDLKDIQRALVIGGGNTAIDAVRELAQLGIKNVSLVYRKTRKEMPGYEHEWKPAQLEGVTMIENAVPISIERVNGHLIGIRLRDFATERMEPADLVIVAIGQSKLHELASQFDVACDDSGCLKVDAKTGQTKNPKVFSGGDCVNGGMEVVNAVAEGKLAAKYMHQFMVNHG